LLGEGASILLQVLHNSPDIFTGNRGGLSWGLLLLLLLFQLTELMISDEQCGCIQNRKVCMVQALHLSTAGFCISELIEL
jgi:hypothetical protein